MTIQIQLNAEDEESINESLGITDLGRNKHSKTLSGYMNNLNNYKNLLLKNTDQESSNLRASKTTILEDISIRITTDQNENMKNHTYSQDSTFSNVFY